MITTEGQADWPAFPRAPDATDAEISYFVRQQANRISPRIGNKIGFLITQVPKCFEGESFKRFRETNRVQSKEAETPDLAEYERILSDDEASEAERRLARQILGQE